MTIFCKHVSEYVALAKPFLGLILVVGVARLALSLGGVPNSVVKWLSITAVIWIGVVFYAVRIHTTGFGSFKQLLPICILQSLTAQVIIVPAIILAILTGNDNVYSAPEFSFGTDGKTWSHVWGHLLVGTTIGSLVGWVVGCLILFVTQRIAPRDKHAKVAVGA
jgi:hypothetical protein